MRKLLCEQANLQNWTWNVTLWESSWIAIGWKEHSMVCSQSCQPGTEVSWWQSLTQALFQTQAKRWRQFSPMNETNHSHFLETGEKKTQETKNPLSFTMNNSADPKHQFCFWGGFETTTPRGQMLTDPDLAQPCRGLLPCTHLGLHPAGSHRRPPPLLANANRFLHNTEAAKRVCVNWSSGRKALWAEKRREPVVPRHQVIWNKAGRRERKDAMPAHSPWLCRLCSLQPPLISAIAALGGSREAASPNFSP